MRTKDKILAELGKNRQPGSYGGIPQDTRDYIFIEALLDIRDTLDKIMLELYRGLRTMSKHD